MSADFVARLREEMERPPYNRWLAPKLIGVDDIKRTVALSLSFRSDFSFHPTEPYYHGGVIAGFADLAGHAAVAVFLGRRSPTISLQVDYIAPARGEALDACGMLRHLGRTIARADVDLHCNGKLVAVARGTFSTRE